MNLETASRKKAKIKMALQGPSGSGKTMSALLIAYGLCGSWDRVAVLDTENRSADLYADLGPYNVLPITAPYTPEKYILAIDKCLAAGMDVIIIDSLSHEWDGAGGILDIHSSIIGQSSFSNWSKVTPRHNAFVQHMLQCDSHIIGTIRTKQDYVLSEHNGKQIPQKVGLKGITKDGMDYEFTLVLDLDTTLKARCSKDRTQLFIGKPEFIPTTDTGAMILKWCNQGAPPLRIAAQEDVLQAIHECNDVDELLSLYQGYPNYRKELANEFTKRKNQLLSTTNKTSENGTY